MCAGAILHSRLNRVIFGTPDPKTGAAGSVLNLFDFPALNHKTRVQGGVLEGPCASLLKEFFRGRRKSNRANEAFLRDDALRTPDTRFKNLPDYPWPGSYIRHLVALNGLRLHYLDLGNPSAERVIFCIHGYGEWSYAFRTMIPTLCEVGCRVLVPDLIGFGRSDKPKRATFHSLEFHSSYLLGLIEAFDLRNVVLLGSGVGASIANTLFNAAPTRVLSVFNVPAYPSFDQKTWSIPNQAPFPDAGHCAALQAFSTFEISAPAKAAYCVADLDESFARDILLRLGP